MVVKPTAIDGNNNFINTTENTVTYDIQVSNGGATATAKLYSTGAGEASKQYVSSRVVGVNSIKITNDGQGSTYCSIYLDSGNKTGICTGGTVTFGLNSGYASDPVYKIDISGLSVKHTYNIVRCGIVEDTVEEDGTISVSVIPKNGVSVIEENSSYVKISVANGITSIYIIIIPDIGERQQITLSIPS